MGKLIHIALFALLLCAVNCEKKEPRKGKRPTDIPKTGPVGDDGISRITVDYQFTTDTVLYEDEDRKTATPWSFMKGNVSFSTMHYDREGSMLVRFDLTSCETNNCGMVPPLYVNFVQGGNNIQSVYAELQDYPDYKPTWNILYSLLNAIYTPAINGDGDRQTVNTVYGNCVVHFGRPEDKVFRRVIDECDLKSENNFTRIAGIQPVHYSQDVWYTQNLRYDADIILIDAVELLRFDTPLHRKWGWTLETRMNVKIVNRTKSYVTPRPCITNLTCEQCALDHFEGVKVGNKLFEDVLVGPPPKPYSLADAFEEYKKSKGHTYGFAKLVDQARLATAEDWAAIIKEYQISREMMITIGNVLGTLGTTETLNAAKEHLFPLSELYIDDYLYGAAQSTSTSEKWHKSLMYWLLEGDKVVNKFWKISNTISTIFRRRCLRTISSWNTCNKDKDRIVSKFVYELTDCPEKYTAMCLARALKVFHNLPIKSTLTLAKEQLCTNHPSLIQMYALRVLRGMEPKECDSALTTKLASIFRNACPVEATAEEIRLAIDILAKCVPDVSNVGPLILRTETNQPIDHERWNYFYTAVKATREENELRGDYWSNLRNFKIFRPTYAKFALNGSSSYDFHNIGEIEGYQLSSLWRNGMANGQLDSAEVEIRLKKSRKADASIAGASGSSTHRIVSILGHHVSFDDFGEGSLVFRSAQATIPLLSGLTFYYDAYGSAYSKTRDEFAPQDGQTTTVFVDGALTTTAQLFLNAEEVRRVDSDLAFETSFALTKFLTKKQKDCMKPTLGKTTIKRSFVEEGFHPKSRNETSRTSTIGAETPLLDRTLWKLCQ